MAGFRRNLFGSVYLTGVNLASQLLLVPVYLHFWGAETYGLWLVLFSVPAVFAFSDAGLSNTVGNVVTLAVEQGKPKEAEAALNAAWKFQSIAWSLLFAGFALGLGVLPIRGLLGVEQLEAARFVPAVLLLCIYSLASLQTGILAAVYRGARRYPLYLTWSGHGRAAEICAVAAALWLGGDIAAVAAAMCLTRVACAAMLFVRGRRLLPGVRLALFNGHWSDLKPLLPSGLAYLSFSGSNALINQGTVLVVNHLLGAPSVVLLSICRQLARVFQQGTQVLITALHPEMTQACGVRDHTRVRDLQALALVVPLLVAVPFVAGNAILGNDVIYWWTRKSLGVSWPLLLVCGIEAVTFGCTTLSALIPWATNQVLRLSVIYATVNALALVVGACGVVGVGLIALPIAFSMANVSYSISGLVIGSSIGGFRIGDLIKPKVMAQLLKLLRRRAL